ncbi:MAG: DUF503 domain-containing protein [Vicinamibacterales bacterium]
MAVVVGLLSVELYLPSCHSLKDKRMVLRSVKDRLKKFNVAVAEVEHLDMWQRGGLGVVAVSNERDHVDRTLRAALDEIERVEPGLVARSEQELLT